MRVWAAGRKRRKEPERLTLGDGTVSKTGGRERSHTRAERVRTASAPVFGAPALRSPSPGSRSRRWRTGARGPTGLSAGRVASTPDGANKHPQEV